MKKPSVFDPALFADDPEWAACVPEAPSGGRKCSLPDHSDCSPLDIDSVARNLMPGGTLGSMPGYESRPGQIDMLKAVVRAFNSREHLMIEAGTGVGKSLAYLVPAVNWAVVNDTPVVISTATRNLQSQLVASDLPQAAKTVPGDVRIALLKGRGNYLCLRALGELMKDGYYAMSPAERGEFDGLARLVHSGGFDGDLDSASVSVLREKVSCSGEECGGRRCEYSGKCFVRKARDRALRAHVVVANHSLVLAEAANPGSGILPAYGRLVFDEAHNLEDIATDFFSFEFSRETVARFVRRITRRRKGRHGGERGFLGTLQRQLDSGAFPDVQLAAEIREQCGIARAACTRVRLEADALIDIASKLLSPAAGERIVRYRRPRTGETSCGRRQYSMHGLFKDYSGDEWSEEALSAALLQFEDRLAGLKESLSAIATYIENASADGELNLFGDLAVQAAQMAETARIYLSEVKFALAGEDPDYVYWAESVRETGGGTGARFVAAPLDVADEMRKCFYSVKDSVVLCSATLRVGDRFDYTAKRLGFFPGENAEDGPDRFKRLVAASPFDYFRQALVLAPDFLPDPAADADGYCSALAPLLNGLFSATDGRGLVLFTAYDMMRSVADLARPLLESGGISLFVQGDGLSREEMAAKLRIGGRTVLFGAQSFWEGVDIAGDALSCVVIARLPFPQAGEPVVEARCERIEESGGSAFRDYMMPEAVIKFRQGFGRLVRSKRDRGAVIVADRRIVSKNYGAMFRKSIAASVHAVPSQADLLSRVSGFLE